LEGLVSPVPGGLSLPGANLAAVVGNITNSSDTKTMIAEGHFVFTLTGF
jgi:hypothetical protein